MGERGVLRTVPPDLGDEAGANEAGDGLPDAARDLAQVSSVAPRQRGGRLDQVEDPSRAVDEKARAGGDRRGVAEVEVLAHRPEALDAHCTL